ncbi:MAG: VOC family protein [Butyrivibrio sp.]|nr:VOC family protein [Butyrivibrio sp.]
MDINLTNSSFKYIISEETTLTVYNDGTVKNNQNQNICLAFTVDDIENEYRKLQALGVRIIEPPTKRPWGAVNMSFYDPDNNVIYFKQIKKIIKRYGFGI